MLIFFGNPYFVIGSLSPSDIVVHPCLFPRPGMKKELTAGNEHLQALG
jgi:hypothetical protein